MAKIDIDRINELAKKKKSVGLTEEELKEQKELYKAYLSNVRRNFSNTMESIIIEEKDGSHTPLKDIKKNKKEMQ